MAQNIIWHKRNIFATFAGVFLFTLLLSVGLYQLVLRQDINQPPILEISHESPQTISWGETVHYQCNVSAGVPSPVLTWTRTDLKPLTSNTEVLPGGVLRINKATGEEEGEYSCRAENSAGIAEEKLKVIVITKGEYIYHDRNSPSS